MTKRIGIPDKQHSSHAPAATEANRKLFLEALAKGIAAADAAAVIGVSRSTAYSWRENDPEFVALWEEAVETGLDRIETALYQRAIEKSDSNAQFILSRRRPGVWGRQDASHSVKAENDEQAQIEDVRETLKQLGYMPRVIEGDYEEVDATPTSDS